MTDAGKRSRIDPSVRGRFVGKGRASSKMFLGKCRLPGCDSLPYLVSSPTFSDRHFLGVPVFLGATLASTSRRQTLSTPDGGCTSSRGSSATASKAKACSPGAWGEIFFGTERNRSNELLATVKLSVIDVT